MRVVTADWSFSKTGVAVLDLSTDGVDIIELKTIKTDVDKDPMERVEYSIEELIKLYYKHSADLIIKESALMGRTSTGLPVIKAHGALEFYCYKNLIPLEEVHNQTMKAYSRKQLKEVYGWKDKEVQELGTKKVVEKFLEMWYDGKVPELYGPRGGFDDDLGDALLIGILYQNKTMGDD